MRNQGNGPVSVTLFEVALGAGTDGALDYRATVEEKEEELERDLLELRCELDDGTSHLTWRTDAP